MHGIFRRSCVKTLSRNFSKNSDFRSSSDRATLAASQETWLETAQTSNEASSNNSPFLAAESLCQDVIKKVFSNNSDFRLSSDRASLAA
ncbi:hypothetical protein DPMN_059923 [Dreissena polymorpha]|uniref:Uncharacterized protein n=1 Tax=Dreissena polymorpha TaxID=45954 RepID=A0A9D4C4A0_DREPO|nr:hypothetical protein DPMN_059923 [Dreissena polymorpha]